MRKFLTIFFLVLSLFRVQAQMQDLTKLAEGELKYSDIIHDNENNLWGYFLLYESDKEKDSIQMEYIVLDKNLNKTYNGTYKTKKNSTFYPVKYNNCVFMGDQFVLDISVLSSDGYLMYNSNRTLPLVENKKSEEFIYEEGDFKEVHENFTKYFLSKARFDSLQNSLIVTPIYRGEYKGYIVTQYNQNLKKIREKEIKLYDEQKNLKWIYRFNPNTSNKTKENYSTYKILNLHENGILAMETDYVKRKKPATRIIRQNINTGDKIFDYLLENDNSKYFHNITTRIYNDTIYIAGQYYNPKKTGIYVDMLGFFRIVLNNRGEEISKKYVPWNEIQTLEYSMSPEGKVNKSKWLMCQSSLIMSDGSVSFVNNEIKNFYYENALVINFDKDFNRKNIAKIEKTRNSTSNGFLYTQYQNNYKSALICYHDKIKGGGEVKSNLLITTVSEYGVNTERIPILEKKEFTIIPIPAKEGYIMLHEYNKKEKYNQIRLERINE